MENETETLDPRPLLLKRMIWDVYPHCEEDIREAQSALGLVPDGDDGMSAEHDASDVRMLRVQALDRPLQYLSAMAAEVVGPYLIHLAETDAGETLNVPDGFYEGFAGQNGTIIFAACKAIIGHLMDTDVLTYGKRVTLNAG